MRWSSKRGRGWMLSKSIFSIFDHSLDALDAGVLYFLNLPVKPAFFVQSDDLHIRYRDLTFWHDYFPRNSRTNAP